MKTSRPSDDQLKKHAEMSREELERELRALTDLTGLTSEQVLMQNVLVHQVELEMQNRELTETQARLLEARDRLADLYDHSPVGYITIDSDSVIKEISLTAASMFDRERSHLIGKTLSGYLSNEDARELIRVMGDAFNSHESIALQVRILRKGSFVPVQLLLMHESPATSKQFRICVINQATFPAQIHERSGSMDNVLDQVQGTVFALTNTGRSVLDSEFHHLTGSQWKDWESRKLRDLFHKDDHKAVEQTLLDFMNGQSIPPKTFRIVPKGGEPHPIEFLFNAVSHNAKSETIIGFARLPLSHTRRDDVA